MKERSNEIKNKPAREAVIEHLQEYGPSTLAQIKEDTGISTATLSAAIRKMLKRVEGETRIIYVKRWIATQEGKRRYPRQVLAIGIGNDAPKPARDINANKRRWKATKLARKRNNFVFNLGAKVELNNRTTERS